MPFMRFIYIMRVEVIYVEKVFLWFFLAGLGLGSGIFIPVYFFFRLQARLMRRV